MAVAVVAAVVAAALGVAARRRSTRTRCSGWRGVRVLWRLNRLVWVIATYYGECFSLEIKQALP